MAGEPPLRHRPPLPPGQPLCELVFEKCDAMTTAVTITTVLCKKRNDYAERKEKEEKTMLLGMIQEKLMFSRTPPTSRLGAKDVLLLL